MLVYNSDGGQLNWLVADLQSTDRSLPSGASGSNSMPGTEVHSWNSYCPKGPTSGFTIVVFAFETSQVQLPSTLKKVVHGVALDKHLSSLAIGRAELRAFAAYDHKCPVLEGKCFAAEHQHKLCVEEAQNCQDDSNFQLRGVGSSCQILYSFAKLLFPGI